MQKENPTLINVTTAKYHNKSILFQILFEKEYDYSPNTITETHWNLRYKLYRINLKIKSKINVLGAQRVTKNVRPPCVLY